MLGYTSFLTLSCKEAKTQKFEVFNILYTKSSATDLTKILVRSNETIVIPSLIWACQRKSGICSCLALYKADETHKYANTRSNRLESRDMCTIRRRLGARLIKRSVGKIVLVLSFPYKSAQATNGIQGMQSPGRIHRLQRRVWQQHAVKFCLLISTFDTRLLHDHVHAA